VRVLVTGAAGFLGSAVVRTLADQGAEVIGLVRDPRQVAGVESVGASAAVGDVLDAEAVARAAEGCEAAVHLAASTIEAEVAGGHAERVRVEGARTLARLGRAGRLRRLVLGSGYWVYRGGNETITEASPVDPRGESRINFEAEQAALAGNAAPAFGVVVVRPGMVYGNGSWFRSTYEAIRSGEYRLVGDGANRWSFVSREDVGTGFARALAAGSPGEVYNLVDGRPAPWREFVAYVANALGRPVPPSLSSEAAAGVYGRDVAHHLAADRPTSSAKLEALGWRPRYPAYREGLAELLGRME
jgi:nucleoside-diphosphate-sugar epimerase